MTSQRKIEQIRNKIDRIHELSSQASRLISELYGDGTEAESTTGDIMCMADQAIADFDRLVEEKETEPMGD
jgi:hypothetical protein